MGNEPPIAPKLASAPRAADREPPFGMNEVRLNPRQWLAALLLIALVLLLLPKLWENIERFETGPDYRIPYQLSKDYWLYGRRLRQVPATNHVIVLGDSVVWGEYVLPNGTLPHFLNQLCGETNRFINAGVNGLFPLALEGLVDSYAGLRQQQVILHCNLLWMTSPKADLSTEKEEPFNHSRLVPQFVPRIPCYRADASERLSALVERQVPFLSWVSHLQDTYFGQKSIPRWTLEDDGGNPPRYPNSYKNPLAQFTLAVPCAPEPDPQRGPQSPRHRPWSEHATGASSFDWVGLEASLQWHAFQRVLATLQERHNDVLVVLGPFNEHLIAEENRPAFRQLRNGIADWLRQHHVPHLVPEILPSSLYADASHPLTEGYELLAKRIYDDQGFRDWMKGR
jgi:hypothetical protein